MLTVAVCAHLMAGGATAGTERPLLREAGLGALVLGCAVVVAAAALGGGFVRVARCDAVAASALAPADVTIRATRLSWSPDRDSPYRVAALVEGTVSNGSRRPLARAEFTAEVRLAGGEHIGFAPAYLWLDVPPGATRHFAQALHLDAEARDWWSRPRNELTPIFLKWIGGGTAGAGPVNRPRSADTIRWEAVDTTVVAAVAAERGWTETACRP